jgi:hypothetical protein
MVVKRSVSRATGLSRVTLTAAIKELTEEPLEAGRSNRPGAGRPSLILANTMIVEILLVIVFRKQPEGILKSPLVMDTKGHQNS